MGVQNVELKTQNFESITFIIAGIVVLLFFGMPLLLIFILPS